MIISVSIPNEELKKIDEFCETKGYKRSMVFLKGSKLFMTGLGKLEKSGVSLEVPKLNMKCDMPFCKNMATTHCRVVSPDPLDVEPTKEHYLCTWHLHKAKQEGGVEEI